MNDAEAAQLAYQINQQPGWYADVRPTSTPFAGTSLRRYRVRCWRYLPPETREHSLASGREWDALRAAVADEMAAAAARLASMGATGGEPPSEPGAQEATPGTITVGAKEAPDHAAVHASDHVAVGSADDAREQAPPGHRRDQPRRGRRRAGRQLRLADATDRGLGPGVGDRAGDDPAPPGGRRPGRRNTAAGSAGSAGMDRSGDRPGRRAAAGSVREPAGSAGGEAKP